MKIIIAGNFNQVEYEDIINNIPNILDNIVDKNKLELTEILLADGDSISNHVELWAKSKGIPVTKFTYSENKAAVMTVHNTKMSKFADGILTFWDGIDKGFKNLMHRLGQHGKLVVGLNLKSGYNFRGRYNINGSYCHEIIF